MLTLLYHDTVSCFSAELVGKNRQDHNNVDRFKWNTDSYTDLSEASVENNKRNGFFSLVTSLKLKVYCSTCFVNYDVTKCPL